LWASDGTPAGTRAVAGAPGFQDSAAVLGDRLVYRSSPSQLASLWISDGTAGDTVHLKDFGVPQPGDPADLVALGGRVYFAARDKTHGLELWSTDGTATGTVRVTNFASAQPFPRNSLLSLQILPVGGHLVFAAADAAGTPRLWRSDGSPASTSIVAPALAIGRFLHPAGGRVLFFANDGVHGLEPWSTDGTTAGTRLVEDVCPGACSSGNGPTDDLFGGGALFTVGPPATGPFDLWVTNGLPAGTLRETDWKSVPGGPRPILFPVGQAGSRLVFATVEDGDSRIGLWSADGTPGGTRDLIPVLARPASSDPANLVALGGQLLFTACDGTARNLWASGGTEATTRLAAGPEAGGVCNSSPPMGPHGLITVGGTAYFRRDTPTFPIQELWRSDGTPQGTAKLADVRVASTNDPPLQFAFEGQLWFVEEEDTHAELWHATPAGASRAFALPEAIGFVLAATPVGSQIFFAAGSGGAMNLFVTDDTGAGLRQIAGPIAFGFSTDPAHDPSFAALGGAAIFSAARPGEVAQLWRSDGTLAGTVPFHAITGISPILFPGNGSLYFLDFDRAVGQVLWRTDGTAAGTVPIATFAGFVPNSPLVAMGGRLYFAADDGVHGAELWESDGTTGGTVLVADVFPGPDPSAPASLTAAGGKLYFTADDGIHGRELWQSDGTAPGTRLVEDVAPGGSSEPDNLTAVGDRLYFSADDGLHGRELWTVTPPGACQPSATRLCLGGRFALEVAWRDFAGNEGAGQTIPLTADTGAFWFFQPTNIELIVKTIDGRGLNQSFWVFYGALSNVEYTLTVTDTQTGASRRYFNSAGVLASIADTGSFGPFGASSTAPGSAEANEPPTSPRAAAAQGCTAGATTLCLNGGRFAVTAAWKDFQGNAGAGMTVPLTADTGAFWFFGPTNLEVVIKVLDGRAVNHKFWVFYGALSNVDYTLTVTDTTTGAMRTYHNPAGNLASRADTSAF
ncbi:MAG TPA: ELWxxDGT repeat protein, partial [Thermoanaerobaculia bacterium]|nr:ELWxxDGT repeat protein [Thermoanaerobaculia bacterium]